MPRSLEPLLMALDAMVPLTARRLAMAASDATISMVGLDSRRVQAVGVEEPRAASELERAASSQEACPGVLNPS